MPFKNSSFADIVLSTEKLLGAFTANPEMLPAVQDLHAPLTEDIAQVKELSLRQQNLTAERQKTTQELSAAKARVVEMGILLRGRVKGLLGPRTEKLVEFQVQPLRPARRRKTAGEPVEPAP